MIVSHSQVKLTTDHTKQQSHQQYERLEHQKLAADGRVQSSIIQGGDKADLSKQALELATDISASTGSNVNIASHEHSSFSQQAWMVGQNSQGPFQWSALSPLGARGAVLEMEPNMAPVPTAFIGPSISSGGEANIANFPTVDPAISMAAAIIAAISGVEIELASGEVLQNALNTRLNNSEPFVDLSQSRFGFTMSAEGGEGLEGMRYHRMDTYHESEQTSFSAQGEIHTLDGKKIDISLMMEMQRSYSTHESTTITAGVQLKDPLVINFAAPSVSLSANTFAFDLDADGEKEHINQIGAGSGMLTLDKNNDGKVNDGRELFGALSGNGFNDLKEYDDDGNGFIDEGDAIYSQLKIWVKTESGGDHFHSLADKGVDAIYLGAVVTPFELKDEDNNLQGQVRSSSFFIGEQGNSGTVQQIDLVV